jgi:hypothetical protein
MSGRALREERPGVLGKRGYRTLKQQAAIVKEGNVRGEAFNFVQFV